MTEEFRKAVFIFDLGYDFVAAHDLESAKKCLAEFLHDGVVTKEFEDEFIKNPHPLMGDKLIAYKVREDYDDHDSPSKTFHEELMSRLSMGEKVPFYFCAKDE